MIDTITLSDLLPRVFAGMEHDEPVCSSQVWLRPHVEFERSGGNWLIAAESGTGKSSLCSFITGSRSDYLGTIAFDGTDIRTFSPRRWAELRCRALALLPQEMRLFPELTAIENVQIKNRLTGFKSQSQILDLFARLGISDKVDSPASRLSVGQQQRVAIIRAVCQPFDFLIIDEPVSHLDARNNDIVAALLQDEASAQGAAIIATSVGNHINLTFNHRLEL